jgi:hypothetical protein
MFIYFPLDYFTHAATKRQKDKLEQSLLDSLRGTGINTNGTQIEDVFQGSVVVQLGLPEPIAPQIQQAIRAGQVEVTTEDGTRAKAQLTLPTTTRQPTTTLAVTLTPVASSGGGGGGIGIAAAAAGGAAVVCVALVLLFLYKRKQQRRQDKAEDVEMAMPLRDFTESMSRRQKSQRPTVLDDTMITANPTYVAQKKPKRQYLFFGSGTKELLTRPDGELRALLESTSQPDCLDAIGRDEHMYASLDAEQTRRDRLDVQLLLADVERLAGVSVDADEGDLLARKETDKLILDIQRLLEETSADPMVPVASAAAPLQALDSIPIARPSDNGYLEIAPAVPAVAEPAPAAATPAAPPAAVPPALPARKPSVSQSSTVVTPAAAAPPPAPAAAPPARRKIASLDVLGASTPAASAAAAPAAGTSPAPEVFTMARISPPKANQQKPVDSDPTDRAVLTAKTQLQVTGRLAKRTPGSETAPAAPEAPAPVQAAAPASPVQAAPASPVQACTFLGNCTCPKCA